MRSRLGLLLVGIHALVLALPVAAAPETGEFLVHRTLDSQQENPVAAYGADGVSLIVWADSRYGVRGQLYDAEGTAAGGALELAPNLLPPIPGEGPARFALEPSAVFLPEGGFMLVWAEERGYLRVAPFFQHFKLESRRVWARRFGASGEALGRAFDISSSSDRLESWPKLADVPGGQLLAVWRSDAAAGGDDSEHALVARHVNRLAKPRGGEIHLSGEGQRDGDYVTFAQGPGGQVLVAFEACCDAGGDLGVYARAYDASTRDFGPLHQINADTAEKQRRPTIAADGDRGFLVLWQGIIDRTTGRIYGRFVDLAGEPAGGQFQVSQGHGTVQIGPAVAARPGGGYLAVWRDWIGVHYCVSAVELDAAGLPLGEPVRLNSRGLQRTGRTSLAADGAGSYLVPFEKAYKRRPAISAARIVDGE